MAQRSAQRPFHLSSWLDPRSTLPIARSALRWPGAYWAAPRPQALSEIAGSWQLQLSTAASVISIAWFNFFGVRPGLGLGP